MADHKVFQMSFSKIYSLLLNKAEKKGRTKSEIETVVCWLTGYSEAELDELSQSDVSYGDFIRKAPCTNPNRALIKGVVCGVRVETVEDPLMREARYLDKLVDELAKGKPLEKILRTTDLDAHNDK